jgi:predicted Zn-dependent protease
MAHHTEISGFTMNFDNLDNEELLRLSLEAINGGRDSEAISMLKLMLSREPGHLYATYLLAAQHAQIGLFDRAESGFRTVVAQSPDFAIARFQLGQLLTMKGAADEARDILSPLFAGTDALSAYARGMSALAAGDAQTGVRELEQGLGLPQEIPALMSDMQRLRDNLLQNAAVEPSPVAAPEASPAPAYLAGYGYGRSGDAE